jgi:hypothetical protein
LNAPSKRCTEISSSKKVRGFNRSRKRWAKRV